MQTFAQTGIVGKNTERRITVSERNLRGGKLRKWIRPLDPQQVENRLGKGTPDTNYSHGWVELKNFAGWNRLGRIDLLKKKFTQNQRIWLRRRWISGGRAFLMIRVGRECYLFTGVVAFDLPRMLDKVTAKALSCMSWTGEPDKGELITCLLRSTKDF